jgi:hypothetical protein
MDVWRVIHKKSEEPDTEWRPIGNKIYTERRFATSSMKNGRGKMEYDNHSDLWVSCLGTWVYRVVKATVKDEEWINVPPKN